jgi:hypothetical protein
MKCEICQKEMAITTDSQPMMSYACCYHYAVKAKDDTYTKFLHSYYYQGKFYSVVEWRKLWEKKRN